MYFFHSNEDLPMGYYFLAIGSIISLFALWGIIKHLKLIVSGHRTPGTVVGIDVKMRYGGNQNKKPYYHPIIEFKTDDGCPAPKI